jgi:hypothetical protein
MPGHILYCLHRDKGDVFLALLIQSISPLKVYRLKRKYYPVEHLDELHFIRSIALETSINVVEVAVAKSENEIEQVINQRYYLSCLTNRNCKDLFGLELMWEREFGYSPLLTQKKYVDILHCNRALLNRHRKALDSKEQNRIAESNPQDRLVDPLDTPFSLADATKNIPPNEGY